MNVNEVDFTRPFKFVAASKDDVYTCTPEGKYCIVSWDSKGNRAAGSDDTYKLEEVKWYVKSGNWTVTYQKKSLPEKFKFQLHGKGIEYTATKVGRSDKVNVEWYEDNGNKYCTAHTKDGAEWLVEDGTWVIVQEPEDTIPKQFSFYLGVGSTVYDTCFSESTGRYDVIWYDNKRGLRSFSYTEDEVEVFVRDGHWTIISPTNENNVTTSEDVTLEDIIAQYAKGSAHKHEQQCPNVYANEALKAFTEATGASVSIIEGTYTILYGDMHFEAEDDERLNDIVKAITLLENC